MQDEFVTVDVTYRYSIDVDFRTRRITDGIGLQGVARRYAVHLASHTVDLDITNCQFVLMVQWLKRVTPRPALPDDVMSILERCADDRDRIIRDDLRVTRVRGKTILATVLNGGAIPDGFGNIEVLKQLHAASRYMRWVACSAAPTLWNACEADRSRKFPQASTFVFLCQAIEDFVLSAWIEHLHSYKLTHLSLHFDGVRVAGEDLPANMDGFCSECSDAIHCKTGFRVHIQPKLHMSFVDMLRARYTSMSVSEHLPEAYYQPGNCIPCALWHLVGTVAGCEERLTDPDDADNKVAREKQFRRYDCVLAAFSLKVVPSLQWTPTAGGRYLFHCEILGAGHCISVKVDDRGIRCVVYNILERFDMNVCELAEIVDSCVDQSAMVFYTIVDSLPAAFATSPDAVLLGMCAGMMPWVNSVGQIHRRRWSDISLEEDLEYRRELHAVAAVPFPVITQGDSDSTQANAEDQPGPDMSSSSASDGSSGGEEPRTLNLASLLPASTVRLPDPTPDLWVLMATDGSRCFCPAYNVAEQPEPGHGSSHMQYVHLNVRLDTDRDTVLGLVVLPTHYIGSVRTRIATRFGLSPSDFYLLVNGRHLSNQSTVASAELKHGDHVIVVSAVGGTDDSVTAGADDGADRSAPDRQIFARLPCGRMMVVDMNGHDTVHLLRAVLSRRLSVDPEDIYLRYGGRGLSSGACQSARVCFPIHGRFCI